MNLKTRKKNRLSTTQLRPCRTPFWQLPRIGACPNYKRKSVSADLRSVARPGRNDPCPYGLGKKLKKCCGTGLT
nr:hypothetical protein [Rhizobium azibense]